LLLPEASVVVLPLVSLKPYAATSPVCAAADDARTPARVRRKSVVVDARRASLRLSV
jgi:hypothetical protein